MRRVALLTALSLLLCVPASAGRLFDDAASDNASLASALTAGHEWAVFAQVSIDDATGTKRLFSINDTAGPTGDFEAVYVHDNDYGVAIAQNSPDQGIAASGTTIALNTWGTLAGSFEGDSKRTCWVNGSAGAPETTTAAPTGMDATYIGGFPGDFGGAGYFSGSIGPMAVYAGSGVPPASQMESLAAGAWPPYVASAKLAWLFQMTGQRTHITSVVGGGSLTTSGTARVGHPNLGPWPGMQQ